MRHLTSKQHIFQSLFKSDGFKKSVTCSWSIFKQNELGRCPPVHETYELVLVRKDSSLDYSY